MKPLMSTSFQEFNRNLIKDLRTNGKATSGPFEGRKVLILTTKGAKSGEVRENPLVYTRDGDHIVIVASKGGAPTHPAWYHNLSLIHISEPTRLGMISYAVFCLKKKKTPR